MTNVITKAEQICNKWGVSIKKSRNCVGENTDSASLALGRECVALSNRNFRQAIS